MGTTMTRVPTRDAAILQIATDCGTVVEVCRADRPEKYHVVEQLPDGTRRRWTRSCMAHQRAIGDAEMLVRMRNERHAKDIANGVRP